MSGRGCWTWLLSLAVLAPVAPLPAQGPSVVNCANCHADRVFLIGKAATAAAESALYVPAGVLQGTVHSGLRCADCHRGFDLGYPHASRATTRECSSCHEQQGREWDASIHAPNAVQVGDAPTCTTCHGTHVVYSATDRRSPTYPLNVPGLCGRCHADPRIIGMYFATPEKAQARNAVAAYFQTVHGTAVTKAGLVVAATCNDCHRAHEILPADSAASSLSRGNVAQTCGTCHEGVAEVFAQSAHGVALSQGLVQADGDSAPVCTDCHRGHKIVRADQPQWFLGVVQECGDCHEKLYETYFETYHGKVTQLGFGLTAKCSDCHTAHNMRAATDPQSSVYPLNLVKTCGQCHPDANTNFVKYYAHGDPKDRHDYPLLFWPWLAMTVLLVGVFSFFGLHTALWLTRLAMGRLGRRGSKQGSKGVSP